MPIVNIEQLPKNQIKFTITVPSDELRPFLEEAVVHLSEHSSIPGFRPGKAGYDIVKQRFGEMKIYEEALENIVRKTYIEAVDGNKVETVGSPKIDIVKLAPGNDLIYTAEVTRMPNITRLTDFRKISVKTKTIGTDDKDVDLALKDLQRMKTKEIRGTTTETLGATDKAILGVNMKKDGVPVEGGQSPNHAVFLNENYYIPGFKEQLVGMKEGEQKTFSLEFPKEHAQSMLAGKPVDFEVTLKELYHLSCPEMNDEFASLVGQKDLAALKELILENIKRERAEEEKVRQEKELLEAVANESRFEDIPDLLLNEEINRMIQELTHRVEEQGLEFETYLKHLKKTLPELKMEFTPQAILRVKVALLVREIGKRENITVETKELDEELDRLAAQYESKEEKQRIYSPAFREYMETMVRNRKVVEFLRGITVKP